MPGLRPAEPHCRPVCPMTNGGSRPISFRPAPLEPTRWASGPDGGPPNISAAWLSQPRVGESVSGDAVVVRRHGNAVLVTLIDALGHGPRAAEVADAAVDWLGTAEEPDTSGLVNGLHRKLVGSRGIAALLLLISAKGLEACSVGN